MHTKKELHAELLTKVSRYDTYTDYGAIVRLSPLTKYWHRQEGDGGTTKYGCNDSPEIVQIVLSIEFALAKETENTNCIEVSLYSLFALRQYLPREVVMIIIVLSFWEDSDILVEWVYETLVTDYAPDYAPDYEPSY
jgi:hypothetical protein